MLLSCQNKKLVLGQQFKRLTELLNKDEFLCSWYHLCFYPLRAGFLITAITGLPVGFYLILPEACPASRGEGVISPRTPVKVVYHMPIRNKGGHA